MEGLEQPRFHYGIVPLALVPLAGLLILNAFSSKIRKAILDRDQACVDATSSDCLGSLQAAHNNHDRNNEEYDSVDNGSARCVRHHYMQHFAARDTPRCIGMTKNGNASAIRYLHSQLAEAVLFESEDSKRIDASKYFEP